jgi:hypothetical protein
MGGHRSVVGLALSPRLRSRDDDLDANLLRCNNFHLRGERDSAIAFVIAFSIQVVA